jgi:two-component system chemotaxis sensor kinase CheA|tara:strand:- start:4652 stop:7390 length:2739 start_codon:yes stop_codon:yes gene_type:complete
MSVLNSQDDTFRSFLVEMGESLQSMEEAISELEKSYDIQVVNSLFRSVHTIKGGAGFFELKKVQDLSHEFENILMGIREETIEFKNEMLPVFYEACDALKEMHESENYGSNLNIDSICQGLDKFKVRNDNAPLDEPLKEDIDTSKKIAPKTNEESSNDKESFPENPSKEIVSVELDQSRPGNLGKEITEEKKAGRYQEDAKKQRKAPNQNETIRVNIDLLNKLMELTGEIVLGRNQLLQQFSGSEEKSTLVAMAHMISDLQQIVLQTRMQPIGGTFTKFNRIVRELAKKLNKEINLIIKGEDTELDRTIVESLSDPLTHLIRNCAGHGIESSQDRLSCGKDKIGTIIIEARQEGGKVALIVKDDGCGIDIEQIKKIALAKQIISQNEIDIITDSEAAKLIYYPGLSTATEVTEFSGRGVGMDVVKSTFEKLGGAIDLESTRGEGTCVTVHLPTTLTIMSSLIVRIDGDRFAVPHSELKEVISVRPDDELQIEKIQNKEVYRLRGNLIPILTLRDITYDFNEITESHPDLEGDLKCNICKNNSGLKTSNDSQRLFLVLHSGANQFGLIIDSIDHTEEIVVKPLANILSKYSYYAGSSILGDSDVAMVLSANGISQSRKLNFHETENYGETDSKIVEGQLIDLQEKQDLLLFKYAHNEQLAVPLSLVFKVEQLVASDVQSMSDSHYANIQGKNILLLYLNDYLSVKPFPENLDTFYIIIPKIEDFNVGIVASEIVESAHINLKMESSINSEAVLGITDINNQLTYIIDLFNLAEQVNPVRFKTEKKLLNPKKNRLLVVEDTPFFRQIEKNYFESAGFKVSQASNGKEALDILLKEPNNIDLIVSDIVMPIMDGYELVGKIKTNKSLMHIPVYALTSYTEKEHEEKALAAGFDGYSIKTNKENILKSVTTHIAEG